MSRTVDSELPALQTTVKVRGMKVAEVNLLQDRKALMSGTSVNEILKACTEEGFFSEKKPEDLLSGDRNRLLIDIRRATFGGEYDFKVSCPGCAQQSLYSVDLGNFKNLEGQKELVKAQLADKKALHKFKFPVCEKTALFKFRDGVDEKKAIENAKNKGDQLATSNLLLAIKGIEGLASDGIPLKAFIQDLEAEDADAFAEYYKDCEPGVDDKVELICPNGMCNTSFEVRMPLDRENFFKRSSRKKPT